MERDRDTVIQYLATLDADEFRQLLAEALGATPPPEQKPTAQTRATQGLRDLVASRGGGTA